MKNSGKFQNSMRAVTINSEFSLPGLILGTMTDSALSRSSSTTVTIVTVVVVTMIFAIIIV